MGVSTTFKKCQEDPESCEAVKSVNGFVKKCLEDPDWCEAVKNELASGGGFLPAFLKKADMEVWSNSRCSQHKSECGEITR